jgi:hypothetical protein
MTSAWLTRVLLPTLIALLALAPLPAFAAGPTIIDETLTPPPARFVGSCPGFAIDISRLTIERRRILFHDEAGALVREIRQVHFTGALTNAGTGKTVPYEGHFTLHFDYPAGTATRTGLLVRVPGANGGVLALNTGMNVQPIGGASFLEEAGHTFGEFMADLCPVLT